MFPSISVAQVFLDESAIHQIDQIIQQVALHSMMSDRNESLSLWRDCENPGSFLAIASCLVDEVRENSWAHIEAIGGGTDSFESIFGPVDLHTMLPHRIHGMQARKAEVGQLVSVSLRRADPGRTEGLMDEVEGIFESIKYIDGYLGSAMGSNTGLPEEVIGLVFWRDMQSFEDSGPRRGLYEIRVYQRLA